jgi:hypothetical protein
MKHNALSHHTELRNADCQNREDRSKKPEVRMERRNNGERIANSVSSDS